MEDNIYESYGRFAIQFERVCSALEICIQTVLEKEGLKNQGIQEIILAGMTANPLQSLARSLISESIKPNAGERSLIKYVFKEFTDLVEERNDLIHGKLWIYSSMEGEHRSSKRDYMVGSKLHKDSAGSKPKDLEYDTSYLLALKEDAISCFHNILQIKNCIKQDRDLLTNFEVTGAGKNMKYTAKEVCV